MYVSIFCVFRGLGQLGCEVSEAEGQYLLPSQRFINPQKGSEIVGSPWSCIILGPGAFKGNHIPRASTYGDWPFELSLVGRAAFLEARAATRPTSPRCTASSSF